MVESICTVEALRRQIVILDRRPVEAKPQRASTGHADMDHKLSGGLAHGRVHELFGAAEEEGATAGIALLFAQLMRGESPILWLKTAAKNQPSGLAYGPGLTALGMDPAHILMAMMPDDRMLLRASVDALRCAALGGVLIELRGRAPLLDLTASRRLALAAEASGVVALIMRIGADPIPSAAETRWRVEAAPSLPAMGDIPGQGAFNLTLLRQRSGPDGMRWCVTWNSERGCFEDNLATPTIDAVEFPSPKRMAL